jgi:hypothetical protein
MATVRMADYLKRDITTKFKKLYNKSNPKLEHSTYVGDKLYDLLLGAKTEEFKEQVSNTFGVYVNPEKFFLKSNKLPVSLSMLIYKDVRDFDDIQHKYVVKVEEEFEDEREIDLPLSGEYLQLVDLSTSWTTQAVTMKLDNYEEKEEQLFQLYTKKIISVEQRETKRLAKRAADVHKVEQALEQFTTLNQALKAWPALTKLVDQDKISKVHEKQQRKRKEQQQRSKIKPIEQGLNQTILTASLLGED